jgi:hypothetical protein
MKEKRKTAPMEPVEHIIVAGLEAKKEILARICIEVQEAWKSALSARNKWGKWRR